MTIFCILNESDINNGYIVHVSLLLSKYRLPYIAKGPDTKVDTTVHTIGYILFLP